MARSRSVGFDVGVEARGTAGNTTKILRHINAVRCLRLLRDGRSVSRADMARELGLTRATIGNAINVLEGAGYIVEGDMLQAEGKPGRPGIAVSLNPTGAYFLGVDIGTKALTAVLIDLRMGVVSRIVEPTGPGYRDAESIVERLPALVSRAVGVAAVLAHKIRGMCVSVPGLVARDGSVINAPFLGWRDFPLRNRLLDRLGSDRHVVVCNDASAFANAEAPALVPVYGGSVLLVLMAEGIGGAIIGSGRPITGAHGYAGEIGHTVVAVRGQIGTFELLAGAKSFAGLFGAEMTIAEGVAAMLGAREDPRIVEALDFWSEALATGLANAVYLLDPGRIVLGGPVAALYPAVAATVEARLASMLLPGYGPPPIFIARYGADGAAIGAAATIRETLFTLPELDRTTS